MFSLEKEYFATCGQIVLTVEFVSKKELNIAVEIQNLGDKDCTFWLVSNPAEIHFKFFEGRKRVRPVIYFPPKKFDFELHIPAHEAVILEFHALLEEGMIHFYNLEGYDFQGPARYFFESHDVEVLFYFAGVVSNRVQVTLPHLT